MNTTDEEDENGDGTSSYDHHKADHYKENLLREKEGRDRGR
jgi:hypothetical protein